MIINVDATPLLARRLGTLRGAVRGSRLHLDYPLRILREASSISALSGQMDQKSRKKVAWMM